MIFLFPFLTIFAFFYICSLSENRLHRVRLELLLDFFSDFKVISIFIYNLMICILVSFIWNYITHIIKNAIGKLKQAEFHSKLVTTAQKIFKSPKYMDPLIQESKLLINMKK